MILVQSCQCNVMLPVEGQGEVAARRFSLISPSDSWGFDGRVEDYENFEISMTSALPPFSIHSRQSTRTRSTSRTPFSATSFRNGLSEERNVIHCGNE
jgi:hypothetical protein